ncbi:hypothetical protein C2G38_2170865 [Gigaspora rosea]|uniref:Uncharacterized protein n=1 Tax=Gigaspora rosea TaxID=44941 RepID=A0A397VM74_9GLOM|nr:hypothetical protein C2G38_2170865 [Gigaspora rosea]
MHSGFKIDSLTYEGSLQKKEIPAFEWSNHAESFVEQRNNVTDYLTKHLGELLPKDVVILDVANNKGFINTYGRGTTDIAPVERSSIDSLTPRTGIHAIIELKKKNPIIPHKANYIRNDSSGLVREKRD